MFGKVIIFGPGYRNRKAENEVRGAETEKPGIVGRAINRLVQYAVKKMLGTAGTGNRDVYDAISLNEQEARRGGKVVYMDEKRSRQLSVTIPPGIKEGQLIRLRGMGDGGDLYLKVEIKRPILEKVKKLLKI
jgi:DnaJ-class molecular chaperone